MASLATAHGTTPTSLRKLSPVASPPLRLEIVTLFLSSPMAAYGRWAAILSVSLGMARQTISISLKKLFPAASWRLQPGIITVCLSNLMAAFGRWVGNPNGQLGDGTFTDTNQPQEIVASGVTAITGGAYHSLFLKSDGSLWAMGYNYNGELGDGTFSTNAPYGTSQPEEIVASGVTVIAAGGFHNLFLKSDGSMWGMGANGDGELGDGTWNDTNKPEEIVAGNVTAVAAGGGHSLFLKSDGSLWAMGLDYFGQLGDAYLPNTLKFDNQPKKIVASNVAAIAAGGEHSLFLKSDGSLWAMGYNGLGQLGDGFIDTNSPYGSGIPEQTVLSSQSAFSAQTICATLTFHLLPSVGFYVELFISFPTRTRPSL